MGSEWQESSGNDVFLICVNCIVKISPPKSSHVAKPVGFLRYSLEAQPLLGEHQDFTLQTFCLLNDTPCQGNFRSDSCRCWSHPQNIFTTTSRLAIGQTLASTALSSWPLPRPKRSDEGSHSPQRKSLEQVTRASVCILVCPHLLHFSSAPPPLSPDSRLWALLIPLGNVLSWHRCFAQLCRERSLDRVIINKPLRMEDISGRYLARRLGREIPAYVM